MTLGEGKKKVLMLLDEYSAGGAITTDADIANKMAPFFDMAQKDVAKHKPVYKELEAEVTEESGILMLPDNCAEVYRIWRDGRLTRAYTVRGRQLVLTKGKYIVEYRAVPEQVTSDTPDEYVFELCEEACALLPFYVASMQLITDLVVDYGAIWNIYKTMLAELDKSEPVSGMAAVRQTFFRSGR